MHSTRTHRCRIVNHLALVLGAVLSLAAGSARADVAVAADLELDVPLDLDVNTATAFALRVGWQLHLPLFAITPEVGYHHASFGDDVTLNRAFAGVRVAVGEIFRVGAFGHVGYGDAAFRSGGDDQDLSDATYDVGGFIDFTVLPLLDLGVHAGYGLVKAGNGRDPLDWVPVGIHAALIF